MNQAGLYAMGVGTGLILAGAIVMSTQSSNGLVAVLAGGVIVKLIGAILMGHAQEAKQ